MLEDTARTEAFREAIFKTCKDKVVLEVGCGTGILSVFAAQAGASRVVAVEARPETATCAREVVEANGLSDIITVLDGYVEDAAEDVDALLQAAGQADAAADVIVSEWMGFMLVCEDMFPSVAFARDRWLAPDGIMLPSQCKVWLAPFSNPALVEKMSGFWHSRPYGVDLSVLASRALDQHLSQPVIDTLKQEGLLAPPLAIWTLDCAAAEVAEFQRQELPFCFRIAGVGGEERQALGTFHGLAAWFTCELLEGVCFSTGPEATPTHWEQTLLFVGRECDAHDRQIVPGDEIEGELRWLVSGNALGVVIKGTVRSDDEPPDVVPATFGRRLVLHVA